jgi:glutaredoxin-related protein
LHIIGQYLGFTSFIGKREQATDGFKNIKFSDISISNLNLKEFERMDKAEVNKIMQIDLVWLDKFNNPRYAFEVEESTSIISAFDRFTNLLKADHSISKNLFIVLPRKREKTFNDRLKTSIYIGQPVYLEQKMKYIYKEDLKKFYDEHIDKNFDELDLKSIFVEIEI